MYLSGAMVSRHLSHRAQQVVHQVALHGTTHIKVAPVVGARQPYLRPTQLLPSPAAVGAVALFVEVMLVGREAMLKVARAIPLLLLVAVRKHLVAQLALETSQQQMHNLASNAMVVLVLLQAHRVCQFWEVVDGVVVDLRVLAATKERYAPETAAILASHMAAAAAAAAAGSEAAVVHPAEATSRGMLVAEVVVDHLGSMKHGQVYLLGQCYLQVAAGSGPAGMTAQYRW